MIKYLPNINTGKTLNLFTRIRMNQEYGMGNYRNAQEEVEDSIIELNAVWEFILIEKSDQDK